MTIFKDEIDPVATLLVIMALTIIVLLPSQLFFQPRKGIHALSFTLIIGNLTCLIFCMPLLIMMVYDLIFDKTYLSRLEFHDALKDIFRVYLLSMFVSLFTGVLLPFFRKETYRGKNLHADEKKTKNLKRDQMIKEAKKWAKDMKGNRKCPVRVNNYTVQAGTGYREGTRRERQGRIKHGQDIDQKTWSVIINE